MKTLLLFISLFIIAADAATVRLYFTDPLTNEKDTNAFYITPVGTNVLSNGGVVGRGVTTRYVPASNGYRTNTLAVGHYSVTNRSLGSGVVIRVPESSSLYDYTNLLISGYNIFVTVTNGSGGGSGDVTESGLADASYAINPGGITNSLYYILSTNFFTTAQIVTNVNTFDFGNTIVLSSTTDTTPGLSIAGNTTIQGVVLTNRQANNLLAVTLGAKPYSQRLFVKDSWVDGDGYALKLEPGSGFQTNGLTFTSENTYYRARSTAAEVWRYKSVFKDCTFDATVESSYFSASAAAFSANDQSTNYFSGCEFIYGANTNEIAGFVGYLESASFFNSCRFVCVTNATTNSAIGMSAAVFTGEEATYATFQNCDFKLNGGMLVYSYDPTRTTNNIVEFRDCYITPWTNGIVCTNDSFLVRVAGGNLKPSNFKYPNLVVWLNETNEVVVSSDLVINTYYTNSAKLSLLSVDCLLQTTDASDTANIELRVDQQNNGSFETVKTCYLAGVTDSQSMIAPMSAVLIPHARYILTNLSSGGGVTADVNPNSTQITPLR